VLVDPSGDLIIADNGNNRVQEVAASSHSQFGVTMTAGDIYTIAGSAEGTAGSSSGVLNGPSAVALDTNGNLYIADTNNNRIEKVAATSGAVSTVAGSASGSSGSSGGDGVATSALLDQPQGVAVDPSGDLFIADTENNRIEEVPASTGTQWGVSIRVVLVRFGKKTFSLYWKKVSLPIPRAGPRSGLYMQYFKVHRPRRIQRSCLVGE
jgi:sugar lactone lactonase YvrE